MLLAIITTFANKESGDAHETRRRRCHGCWFSIMRKRHTLGTLKTYLRRCFECGNIFAPITTLRSEIEQAALPQRFDVPGCVPIAASMLNQVIHVVEVPVDTFSSQNIDGRASYQRPQWNYHFLIRGHLTQLCRPFSGNECTVCLSFANA